MRQAWGFILVMSPPPNGIETLLSKDTNTRKLIWGTVN